MKLIKLIGVEGQRIDIIPRTEGMNLTEIWNKKGEYLGMICFDKRWKKYVLVELDAKMQMSMDCLDEAFTMTREYWKKRS